MAFRKSNEKDSSNENSGSSLVKIGVLWETDDNSKAALSGVMGDANLVIFENSFKKEDNQPDYVVYVSKRVKKEQGDDVPF